MVGPTDQVSVADMRAALDRVSDGMMVFDRHWRLTFVNRAAAGMLGLDPGERLGNLLVETVDVNGTLDRRSFIRAVRRQIPFAFVREFPTLGRTFDLRVYPSSDGITVMLRDVTVWRGAVQARKNAINELRSAEVARKRFEALVEASEDFIAIFDPNGRSIQYLNPGARALIGLPDDAATTGLSFDAFTDKSFVDTVIMPALERSGVWTGEKTLLHQVTGEPIPVAASHYLIHDPDSGEPLAYASVQRDIRERVATEARLRDLVAHRRDLLTRLMAAQEAERERIAADVHDDSVQALAAVDLRLGMLARRVQTAAPQLLDQVTALQAAVSDASGRLRNLLFELEAPAEGETLGESLRSATERIMAGNGIAWTLTGDLDIQLSHAGHVQALRIAKEALGNAARHSGARHIELQLTRREGGVEIAVNDDGVGVDPDAISPPGHRGLATMRDRAEVAGGWCRLERRAPSGTTVRFYLRGAKG